MSIWSIARITCGNFNFRNVSSKIIRSLSSFDKMVDMRRCQARKSVVIHLESKNIVCGLLNLCHKFGQINNSFLYTLPDKKEFILLEFNNENGAADFVSKIGHITDSMVIPVHTRFLLYHAKSTQQSKNETIPAEIKCDISPTDATLCQILQSSSSLSDQMQLLYETLQLSEVKKRLCFFTCLQIEEAYRGLFPACKVLPFGSSVSGLGRYSCDLDMIMVLNPPKQHSVGKELREMLTFHNKLSQNNSRTQTQRYLETLADTIKIFLPGCSNVHRILHARVPIIKFQHELAGFECDLTIENLSGYYMSELLYHYGQFDQRVRPLVFTILMWARQNALTHESPGHWITNITLTLMVIFFLQVQSKPVLPSLGKLKKLAGKEDVRAIGGSACTFLRDVKKFPPTQNTENLGQLLRSFFTYYANFDMDKNGMCIISGCPIMKPESGSVYMRNPLELELNVSKNMNNTERKRFSACVENGVWILENSGTDIEESSILAHLFNSKPGGNTKQSEKAFQVKSLFTGDITYHETKTPKVKPVPSSSTKMSSVSRLKRVHSRTMKKAPWVW